MNDDALQQKRKLYKSWDSLADSDDEDAPDPGTKASIEAMQKAARSKGPDQQSTKRLARSVSDSKVSKLPRNDEQIGLSERPPASAAFPASLASRHTFSGTTGRSKGNDMSESTIQPKAVGKRKRDNIVYQLPVDQQIFDGLRFFFFPNTDTNPARKMRIAKSVEYGAVRLEHFDENVSHVVVDKNLDYGQLLQFLKLERMPSHIIVVSEDYPAECISFRRLLDPHQPCFRTKGQLLTAEVRPVSAQSEKSLDLKAATKSVTAREPQTPDNSTPAEAARSAAPNVTKTSRTRDQTDAQAATPSNIESTAEFDAAIAQARDLQHVPLDADEEAASRPTSSEGPATDDEDAENAQQDPPKKKSKYQNFQDKFQCMQKHAGSKTETPNAATIAILQQVADYYDKIGDEWRLRAYRKAMATLRNHPTKVCTKEEALALPQIGERLATKIEEIVLTNRLRRLDNAKAEPSDQTLQAFMQIYGVGPAQASRWVDAGYKTVDELLAKAELTTNQRIGIEHYEDFNSRIPRAEVEQHGDIVKKALLEIDPAFEILVGGSYRRGAATSGDVDCLITRPVTGSEYIRQVVLDRLVPQLFAQKFLVASLATTSKDDGSKWHGASQIPASSPGATPRPWRRIDFLLVPSDQLGAALIYFTGDDVFNRSIRLLAGTKGMRLNQRGLYKDVLRGKGREKLSEGTLVEGKDEEKIFKILGVPWRPPEHRIC